MTAPTLGGFLSFIRNVMSITSTVLPDNSQVISDSFNWALEVASINIASASALAYQKAVYNLAGDTLLNDAQDLPGAAAIPGSGNPPLAYFAYVRKTWNINGFVSGVVQSTGDESTNESLIVQKAAENFTLSDLQNLKTPYGRAYLAIAQRQGTLWGLT